MTHECLGYFSVNVAVSRVFRRALELDQTVSKLLKGCEENKVGEGKKKILGKG